MMKLETIKMIDFSYVYEMHTYKQFHYFYHLQVHLFSQSNMDYINIFNYVGASRFTKTSERRKA
jgi:hypothetical protein